MDYGKIIRDSFAIGWRHKSLWILGLFAGSETGLNNNLSKDDLQAITGTSSGSAWGRLGEAPEFLHILAPYLIGIVIFILFYMAMHCIATPALIDAVNRITRGGRYKLSESFSTGIDFFWRILGMVILMTVAILIGVGTFATIIILGFKGSVVLGVIALLLAIPIILFLAFATLSIYGLAQRAMVARNISIGDSLAEGYALFRTHLGKCLVMALITIGIGIALAIVASILALLIMAPIGLLAYSMGLAVWQAFLIAIILSLPITIPVGGYMGTFHSSVYTMFYFALVEPQGPQYAAPQPNAGYSPSV